MKTFSFSVIALLMLSSALVQAGGRRERGGAGGVGSGGMPNARAGIKDMNCFDFWALMNDSSARSRKPEITPEVMKKYHSCGLSTPGT